MTKEEIRYKNNIFLSEVETFDENDLYSAMDEYANQEAIAFNEWLRDNNYSKSEKGWYQSIVKRDDFPSGFMMMSNSYEFYSIDTIYELFQLQKK